MQSYALFATELQAHSRYFVLVGAGALSAAPEQRKGNSSAPWRSEARHCL